MENLRVLRIAPWAGGLIEGFLRSLLPNPGGEVPCRSLQEIEIEYTHWESKGQLQTLFISLVRERKRAGHQLRFLRLVIAHESDRDLVEELKEDVGEVQARVWD